MKNPSLKRKFLIFMLIESVPFILNLVFYKNGAVDDIYLLLPVLIAITVLNVCVFKKASHFLLMQASTLLFTFLSEVLSSHLYFFLVSSDEMTKGIGIGFTVLGAVAVIILTHIGLIFRLE